MSDETQKKETEKVAKKKVVKKKVVGKPKKVASKKSSIKNPDKTNPPTPQKEAPKKPEPLSSTSFTSDTIDLTLKTFPKCRCHFVVSVKPPMITSSKSKAIKEIAKQVSIPGFRKGKVPASVLLKKFPEAIEQETKKQIANATFIDAQKLSKIDILKAEHKISYDFDNYENDNIQLTYTFESEPEVPEIKDDSYTLKPAKIPEIDDKKINSTIEQIRGFFAEFKEITDRKVQENDFATVSIDDLDQDPPATVFTNTRFQMTDEGCAKWMRDLIIDRSIGDKIEGISEPNKDDSEEVKKEFKPKKVMIHIKEIKEANLPEIDDELAKKVGMPDLKSMKDKLKELLDKKEAQASYDKQKEDLIKQLTSNVLFDLPASVLEKESNHRMNTLFQNKPFLDQWKIMEESAKEKKKEEIIQQAKEALSIFYLCQKVIKDNNIPLTPGEEEPLGTTLLDMMFAAKQPNTPPKDKNDPNYLSLLMLEKAQDFLIEKATKENA